MHKIILCLFLLLAFTTQAKASPPTTTVSDNVILGIDNPIIYFDWMVDTPCFPFLVEDGNAYYCSINNTIYYGNRFTTDYEDVVKYFVLSHEDGHSNDPDFLDWDRTTFDREQYADCYGGIVMQRLYEQQYLGLIDLQLLYNFISSLPSGNDHGTPQQRYTAFAYGYLHNNCEFDIL